MTLNEAKQELAQLTEEITKENFSQYYDKFEAVIIAYQNGGGKGKPIYNFLSQLCIDNLDDWQYEIVMDTLDRLVGFCSPHLRLVFSDYDQKNNKWLEDKG